VLLENRAEMDTAAEAAAQLFGRTATTAAVD
jgi:hypothetical protein